MGGDFGPPNLVAGAVMALRQYSHINKLYLVGDSEKIEAQLKKHGCTDSRIEIFHSTQVVDMSDRAVEAVRRKKDSSISRAVDLVKRDKADAVVSAGHTGAAVAASAIMVLRNIAVSPFCWDVPVTSFALSVARRPLRGSRARSAIWFHGVPPDETIQSIVNGWSARRGGSSTVHLAAEGRNAPARASLAAVRRRRYKPPRTVTIVSPQ